MTTPTTSGPSSRLRQRIIPPASNRPVFPLEHNLGRHSSFAVTCNWSCSLTVTVKGVTCCRCFMMSLLAMMMFPLTLTSNTAPVCAFDLNHSRMVRRESFTQMLMLIAISRVYLVKCKHYSQFSNDLLYYLDVFEETLSTSKFTLDSLFETSDHMPKSLQCPRGLLFINYSMLLYFVSMMQLAGF